MNLVSLTNLLQGTALGRSTRVFAQSDDDPIPLSYLIKQMQIGVVRELIPVLNVLATGWVDHNCQIRSSHWTKDKMSMTIWQPYEGAQDPGGGAVAEVEFKHLGWDPEHTDEEFGKRVVLSSLDKTYKGAGFLAALRNAPNPLDYRQTQTVTQEHSRQVTLDRETTIDIGAEVGTTVGGEVAGVGVSVETKLSTEFSSKVDNSQTDSESKSQSIEKEITYEFPAGSDSLMTLNTQTLMTRRPLRINGAAEFGVRIQWPKGESWDNDIARPSIGNLIGGGNPVGVKVSHGNYVIEFKNWSEFEQFIYGYNTDFPAMEGAWDRIKKYDHKAAQAIVRLLDPTTRSVAFTGQQHEQEDGVITDTVEDVTGRDLSAIQKRQALPPDLVEDPGKRVNA